MSQQLKDQFLLSKDITFLNFGSFGACPKPVFEDYQKWQRELESEPVQFITVNGPRYLRQSREALAGYINCKGDELVYVSNPSYAMNIVAKSLDLQPGDEVLSTNMEYGACDRIFKYYTKQKGAKYIRQNINLPIQSKQKLIDDLFKGLTEKTKVIFIGQITSATALILPVQEICRIAKEKGLLTIVDGAHVPGHILLDLQTLGADIYTGACHKWMMAPKGCSFLYIRKELQQQFDPLVISWGYESATPSDSQFLDYHQMQGTRDFSAFLSVPKCLEFMKEYSWNEVSAACREVVLRNAGRFCKLMNAEPLSPLTSEFIPQMFSIPVVTNAPEKLQKQLFERYGIEIPVSRLDERSFIRYSFNAFNTQADLDKLYAAMKEIMETTDLLKAFS